MNLYTTLKELCTCPSVSGREQRIREKIKAFEVENGVIDGNITPASNVKPTRK